MAGYDGESGGAGGYGSYYEVFYPNNYEDAAAYLDGPGSRAYLSTSAYGSRYTSSAYETDRGGVFQQNTFVNSRFTEVDTSYSYSYSDSDGTYTYSHHSIATTPTPPTAAGYGFYSYNYGPTIPNHLVDYSYSAVSTTTHQVGAYTEFDTRFFNTTSYTDGSSIGRYTLLTQEQSGGRVVPGTGTSYSVAGYDYGNGYTVYVHR